MWSHDEYAKQTKALRMNSTNTIITRHCNCNKLKGKSMICGLLPQQIVAKKGLLETVLKGLYNPLATTTLNLQPLVQLGN